MKTLSLSIVMPEKQVYQDDVDMVVVTAAGGEMGFLPDHAPLLARLKPGPIRIKKKEKTFSFAGGSGFAEVRNNRVTVLVYSIGT